MRGKAYANRRAKEERPEGDFYETPRSLVWMLQETGELHGLQNMLDPCAGNGRIVSALRECRPNSTIRGYDLFTGYGEGTVDFLDAGQDCPAIVTNFPFSQWDSMIRHALEVSELVITIGRLNYFGTHARNVSGLWRNLKRVYAFDRMVDYRTPDREDGCFHVGALVTGWFIFHRKPKKAICIEILDVSRYATLGAYTLGG